uniref:Reverse transcriptase domain-containing protein n=1 Tax=Tanacetum cinerariifolium TaxID=118510 RepID=A0A699IG95_TANCI|nr:reverse transcriptase domain-containing protein [Tanacetum cinerariifolium]
MQPRWENDPGKLGTAPDFIESYQSSNLTSSTNQNPKGRNRGRSKQRVENSNLEEHSHPVVTMADQRTMAQLLQAPTEGYEDAIVVPAITANNFELKHGLFTLVQNKKFFGHDKEDPHAHICYFNKITSTLKFPNVPNTSIKLMLFPFSSKFFPPSKTTSLRNEITNFQQRFDESFSEAWDRFKDLLRACPQHGFLELHQLDTFYNALNSKDQDSLNSTAGGNFLDKMPCDCLNIIESKSKVRYSHDKPVVAKVSTNASTSGVSPGVAELKDMVKALLLDKKGQNQSPAPVKAIKESCVTCSGDHSYKNCPATDGNVYRDNIQEYVSQASANRFIPNQNQGNNFNPGLVYEPPVIQQPAYQALAYQAPAPQTQGISKEDFSAYIKANDAMMKNMQTQAITTRSGVSYDGPQIPPLVVENKPEVTKDTVNPTNNENTKDVQPQAVQSKSPVSISEPAIASKRLSLLDLTPTCMTLELADYSISLPVGVAEDVYVKVGSLYFLANFVVVDFDADPRVPLILGRSFIKTGRDLIDVFEGELTLLVGKEAITFNLDQTLRYSANYSDMTAKQIDVIDMACEEYSHEVLGFSDTISSGNPTPFYDLIIFATSSTLTPFENSDFLLEEVDAFLAVEDEPTSSEFQQPYLNPKGDILLLEAFLNDDPSSPLPNQRNYLPKVRKELKICDNKLPIIIAKDLSVEEKTALITVLKSHKRAIAWKLSGIEGINPESCTHKILMEEDFTPAVQRQRRVNPKIHDVIKQEVIKLLDAGLIYPISDSPWVSPVHCVPKKGGFTVVENEDNELISTRLVMGWRNKATRKDNFPLPFMDQMLERLAGNQYYCFLDGFLLIFKFPSIPRIKKKPHSPAHM